MAEAKADELKQQRKIGELLLRASSKGLLEDVKELVRRGASADTKDVEGVSALHLAAARGYLEIVKFLASRGGDLDAETKSGRTPLHFAAAADNREVLCFLLERNAWLESGDAKDDTPLSLACQFAGRATVEALLAAKPNLSSRNRRSLTPLGEAVARGRADVVSILLASGGDACERSRGFSLLHLAAGMGQVGLLGPLLRVGARVDDADNPDAITPLHAAAMAGGKAAVDALLDEGADATLEDREGRTAAEAVPGDHPDAAVMRAVLTRAAKGRRTPTGKPRARAQQGGGAAAKEAGQRDTPPFAGLDKGEQDRLMSSWASLGDAEAEKAGLRDEVVKRSREYRRFRAMAEFHGVLSALRADERFQEDFGEDEVFRAVVDVHRNYNMVAKYTKDERIMGVMNKLRKLNAVGKETGLKVDWSELRGCGPDQADKDGAKAFQLEGCIQVSRAALRAAASVDPAAPEEDAAQAAGRAAREAADHYLPLTRAEKKKADAARTAVAEEGSGESREPADGGVSGGGDPSMVEGPAPEPAPFDWKKVPPAAAAAARGAGADHCAAPVGPRTATVLTWERGRSPLLTARHPPARAAAQDLWRDLRQRVVHMAFHLALVLLGFAVVALLRWVGLVGAGGGSGGGKRERSWGDGEEL